MDRLAELLRQGADKLVNFPTEAQRFITNPQAFTQLLTGKNPMPRETGFAAGATGLPAQQGTVLDPDYQAYMQGYEQGEPFGYAAMATPAVVPVAKALAPKAGQMAENYMVNQGFMPSIVAYHGTPHTIKGKFDISKVGTGEGAQAYGHGMYFAENPAVAKQYATPNDEIVAKAIVNNIRKIYDQRVETGGTSKEAINEARNQMQYMAENAPTPTVKQLYYDGVNNVERIVTNPLGNLYKVDIPDADIPMMLDWGKPLAQQTPEVQAAIKKLGDRFRPLDDMEAKNVTGERLYRRIENSFGKYYGNQANPDASALLNSVGIKGIRYLDEGSRLNASHWEVNYDGGQAFFKSPEKAKEFMATKKNATLVEPPKGTSNFVVFDPSNVKILEQNSKPITRKEILEQQINKIE